MTAPMPGRNFAAATACMPCRAKKPSALRAHDSLARVRRRSRARTRLPRCRPRRNQIESARTQASTVTPSATRGLSLPVAETAPAASNQGMAGRGRPACSRNTTTNNSGPPWSIKNCVGSFMGLARVVVLGLPGRFGWLIVPGETVEKGKHCYGYEWG